MVKEELCKKVVEVRRESHSDDHCSFFLKGCAKVDW